MPVYIYGCNDCECQFEKQMTIANRKVPLDNPCPECHKEGTLEILPTAAVIGDPVKLGVTRLPNWWTDKLKNIKSKHVGSTIKTDSSLAR